MARAKAQPINTGAARKTRQPAKLFEYDFTGVGFQHRVKRDGRRALAGILPVRVRLVREPDNPMDENAVRVIHADTGVLGGSHIGYVAAAEAAIVAPLMDTRKLVFKSATLVSLDEGADWHTGVVHGIFTDRR